MNGAAAINHQIPSLKAANACNGDKNDNSNPQQGTGGFRSPQATRIANDVKTTPLENDVVLRPAPKIPPTAKDSRKLFVGGLPADITDDEFQSFFARFGPVMDSVVMFDRDTGRSRGFGFVTFEDPGVCQHILSLGNQDGSDDASACIARLEMRGKVVEIKAAEPKQPTNSRRVTRGPMYSLNKGSHFRSVTNEPYMEQLEFAYSYNHAPLGPCLFGNSMPNQYMYPAPAGFVAPMYYNGGLPPINYQNQFSVVPDDPNQLSGIMAPHKFPNSYNHGMNTMESPCLLMSVPYAGYPQVPPYAHALQVPQGFAPDVPPRVSDDNSALPFVPGVPTTADEIESTE